jgi:hypothetical protein
MPLCELTREHANLAAATFNPKVAGSIPARPIRFAGLLSETAACARKDARTRLLRALLAGFSTSQSSDARLQLVAKRFSLSNGIPGPLTLRPTGLGETLSGDVTAELRRTQCASPYGGGTTIRLSSSAARRTAAKTAGSASGASWRRGTSSAFPPRSYRATACWPLCADR